MFPGKNLWWVSLLLSGWILIESCTRQKEQHLFTQLSAAGSGIYFSNDIHENDSSNSFINEFGYMGGGVGIGDFNNDGLKDIFFTGNQVSSVLYLNKGDNKFEDITLKAGVQTNVWATGVSIADINHDGYDDIYVCVFGKDLINKATNLLFINQQDLTFKEEAMAYGLADTGYSTQAVFLDYDKDGDLDMYLTNYLLNGPNANTIFPRDRTGRSMANDKLYRNDGSTTALNHPVFSDVTLAANIKEDGYGLGVAVSDLNDDGWPDIYVANDFITNDVLWLNNRNGTFTNCIDKAIQHQSYSSMGADAADINNDGLPDIVTLDMLPEDNERKKTSFSFMNYERYQAERSMGYEPEFMRNMLQLNNGIYPDSAGNGNVPFFSEIGQLAGISATDWSWSVLMADFDNDGWKDIHVTNGVGRDFINGDFLEFSSQVFSNKKSKEVQQREIREKLAALKHINLSNYLYLNNRDYTFRDVSQTGGIAEPSMSNGAAYADLDNDGDLDLVVNNINKAAFVFINNTFQKNKPAQTHYLGLRFRGDRLNTRGFGTRVQLYNNGKMQMQEQNPARGYFSSVDQQLIFGLGNETRVDSIVVTWPDQKKQVIKNVIADTSLTVSWQDARDVFRVETPKTELLFSDITTESGIQYRHHENMFNDFAFQRLLPQKYSQPGPFISSADINNDGTKDFFAGGGFNFSGRLFTQNKEAGFSTKDLVDSIKMEEDEDCIFFDADNDGDPDLLVTSGDIQHQEIAAYYRPRLYTNDGKGNFSLQIISIPSAVSTIAGCVSAGDYDNDGDLDLFIGGRVSKNYPLPPKSFILRNDKGVFTDVTSNICPLLQNAGMLTAAVWTDIDNDKYTDLVIAGEWMPVRFFKNNKGTLHEITGSTGLAQMHGMWRSLVAEDIDNDGDVDLVAGNLGLNCIYKVSDKEPMELYAADIDGNGITDPVMFYYIKDKDGIKRSFPAISRNQLVEQVPSLKKTFLLYKDYAAATPDDIFKRNLKERSLKFRCDETRTCWFENAGGAKFIKHALPMEAQFAPVNAVICSDLDNDGLKDLLLAGNEYQAEVMTGRYDASYGLFLKGKNNKAFEAISPVASGFVLRGDVKDLELIQSSQGQKIILAAVNNDTLRVFKVNTVQKNGN